MQLEVGFVVDASDVPEVPRDGEKPVAFAQRVARAKAVEVAARHPDALILGADTVVILEELIFGKPVDRADARRMLESLSGRAHQVVTALALVDPTGTDEDLAVSTSVTFRALSSAEIDAYVDGGEPFDKAGAYAIQGGAKEFVIAVDGSYSNVVGLPLEEVREMLRRHAGLEQGLRP
jgi:septum formation protein